MNTAQSPVGRKISQKLVAALWIGTILLGVAVCIRAGVVASQAESGWRILGDHVQAGLPVSKLRGEPVEGIERSTRMLLELVANTGPVEDSTSTEMDAKWQQHRGAITLLDARLRWNYEFDLRDVGAVMWRVTPVERQPLLNIQRVLKNEERKANWPVASAQSNQQQFEMLFGVWSDEEWRAEKSWRQVKGWSTAAIAFAACGWLLVIIGIAATGLHYLLRVEPIAQDPAKTGWAVGAWWLSLLVTFGVLGLLVGYRPEIRHYSTLALTVAAALFGAGVVAFFWLTARYVWRQGKLPAVERSGMFNVARLAIVLSVTFLMTFPLLIAVDRKVRAGIANTWRQFPGNVLDGLYREFPIDVWGRNIANAFLQWGIHGGLFWTAAGWIGVAVFMAWRSAERAIENEEAPTWRSRWREIGARGSRTISRSSALLATMMFVLCLAMSTQWLVCLQAEWDRQSARLQNAEWLAEEVAAAGQRLQLQQTMP